MTRDELMAMAVDKAAKELTPESIEFLFRPSTMFELLLRADFDGMKAKFFEWASDESPNAMPHRFRGEGYRLGKRAIEVEKFYRAIKERQSL